MVVPRKFGSSRLATNVQTIPIASKPAEQAGWTSDTFTISVATLKALGNVKYFIVSWKHVTDTVTVKLNTITQGSVAGAASYPDTLAYVSFPIVDPNIAQEINLSSPGSTIKSILVEAVVVTVI